MKSGRVGTEAVTQNVAQNPNLDLVKRLKAELPGIMSRVKLSVTPVPQAPAFDSANLVYRAAQAGGSHAMPQALVSIFLSSKPPSAGGSGASSQVVVNPKTNDLWLLTSHGLAGAGPTFGPMQLPKQLRFGPGVYTLAEVQALNAAAK